MSVNHVAVLTKDRPLSVVPIIVDYYTVPVNRPVKKQGSHRQGLLITIPLMREIFFLMFSIYTSQKY